MWFRSNDLASKRESKRTIVKKSIWTAFLAEIYDKYHLSLRSSYQNTSTKNGKGEVISSLCSNNRQSHENLNNCHGKEVGQWIKSERMFGTLAN